MPLVSCRDVILETLVGEDAQKVIGRAGYLQLERFTDEEGGCEIRFGLQSIHDESFLFFAEGKHSGEISAAIQAKKPKWFVINKTESQNPSEPNFMVRAQDFTFEEGYQLLTGVSINEILCARQINELYADRLNDEFFNGEVSNYFYQSADGVVEVISAIIPGCDIPRVSSLIGISEERVYVGGILDPEKKDLQQPFNCVGIVSAKKYIDVDTNKRPRRDACIWSFWFFDPSKQIAGMLFKDAIDTVRDWTTSKPKDQLP